MPRTLTGWLSMAAVAATLVGCVVSTDPAAEPTAEKQAVPQHAESMPVKPDGGVGGRGGGNAVGCADPNDPATWYCKGPTTGGCTTSWGAPGQWVCGNLTDYCSTCSDLGGGGGGGGGGCTHGCAPVSRSHN